LNAISFKQKSQFINAHGDTFQIRHFPLFSTKKAFFSSLLSFRLYAKIIPMSEKNAKLPLSHVNSDSISLIKESKGKNPKTTDNQRGNVGTSQNADSENQNVKT